MIDQKTKIHIITILGCLALSVSLFSTAKAATPNINFSANTDLNLTGLSSDLYILQDSYCNSVTTSGGVLSVEIPNSYTFGLGTAATTSLQVIPSGGTLALTVDSSDVSSSYISQWTLESSVANLEVAHSVATNQANTWYKLNSNGTQISSYQSNSIGQLTFTYNGGFSSKVFSVSVDSEGPTSFALSSPVNNYSTGSVNQITFSWDLSSSVDVSSYSLFINGTLNQSVNSGISQATASSGWVCGNNNWYVRSYDSAGNYTQSSLRSFDVFCSGAFLGPTNSQTSKDNKDTDPDINQEEPITKKTKNCPLTPNKPHKDTQTSAVYYITDQCTKRPFRNANIFFTYFSSFDKVVVSDENKLTSIPDDSLTFMPYGPKYDPKYGALVKIVTDPKVYLLLGTEKYWITSEVVFNSLKYSWNWIEDVAEELLDKYTLGSEIDYTDHHPNYTLIKYEDNPKVYRLEPDPADTELQVKRYIPDEPTFESLNFRWDRIVTVGEAEEYTDGDNLMQ